MNLKPYRFKLEKSVNNLKGWEFVGNQIANLNHTMSSDSYKKLCESFYSQYAVLMVELAEFNINTIFDLQNYINWIELYGEF